MLTDMCHQVFEVLRTDGAVAEPVQHPERHPDHVLVIDGVHLV